MCFLFQREDWMLSSSLLDVAAKATYSREHGKTKQRKEEERKKETETRKVSNCDLRISYLSQTGLCSAPSFRVVMSKVSIINIEYETYGKFQSTFENQKRRERV